MWQYFLLLFLFPSSAYAYLDPISGSIVIQGLIALFFTIVYFIKRKWHQLKKLLGFSSEYTTLEEDIKKPSVHHSNNK